MDEVIFYQKVEEIKTELKPIINFLKVIESEDIIKISLKDNISFKDFKIYFPDIKKKSLIKLFDFCENNHQETKKAIEEIKEGV